MKKWLWCGLYLGVNCSEQHKHRFSFLWDVVVVSGFWRAGYVVINAPPNPFLLNKIYLHNLLANCHTLTPILVISSNVICKLGGSSGETETRSSTAVRNRCWFSRQSHKKRDTALRVNGRCTCITVGGISCTQRWQILRPTWDRYAIVFRLIMDWFMTVLHWGFLRTGLGQFRNVVVLFVWVSFLLLLYFTSVEEKNQAQWLIVDVSMIRTCIHPQASPVLYWAIFWIPSAGAKTPVWILLTPPLQEADIILQLFPRPSKKTYKEEKIL